MCQGGGSGHPGSFQLAQRVAFYACMRPVRTVVWKGAVRLGPAEFRNDVRALKLAIVVAPDGRTHRCIQEGIPAAVSCNT
jgi:hypothetical protein